MRKIVYNGTGVARNGRKAQSYHTSPFCGDTYGAHKCIPKNEKLINFTRAKIKKM